MNSESASSYGTIICGGGPAGLGPIICALRLGCLDELLSTGVLIIEQSDHCGAGALAHYRVPSNSLSRAFLESVESLTDLQPFRDLYGSPEALALRRAADSTLPLGKIGAYLTRLGDLVAHLVRQHPACDVLVNTTVKRVSLRPDGLHEVSFEGHPSNPDSHGVRMKIGKHVILTMGGKERSNFTHSPLPGLDVRAWKAKFIRASMLMDDRHHVPTAVVSAVKRHPRVAICGGGHSAWSTAWLLLKSKALTLRNTANLSLSVLHRNPVRIFYFSREDARRDNYCFDEVADICPVSGRVHRFGGLRGEARWLARRVVAGLEPRITMIPCSTANICQVRNTLAEAALVIDATGFTSMLPELIDCDGARMVLRESATGLAVNPLGQVSRADGTLIPGVFAYGLGAGLTVSPVIGGEPRYQGRADGVWLYQHDVGRIILTSLGLQPPC